MSDSSPQPVYLFLTPTMADWEHGHAVAHIAKPSWQRRPGRYEVRTVALTREPVRMMSGMTVVPDVAAADVDPAAAATLILPGSDAWDAEGPKAEAFIRSFVEAGTLVAAICGATGALASMGLLDDRDHTSNALEYLQTVPGYVGAERYRDEKAVTDGGIITASATDPVDFAAAIFAELELYEPEVLKAWRGLYTTGDPAHYAVLAAA